MKTGAEEKLLRSLEELVYKSAKAMTPRDFKKAKADSRGIVKDAIGSHRKMMGLWQAMDKRIQKAYRTIKS